MMKRAFESGSLTESEFQQMKEEIGIIETEMQEMETLYRAEMEDLENALIGKEKELREV